MKAVDEINVRIREMNDQVDRLRVARGVEMEKPFFFRRQRTLLFLYVEEKRYEAQLKQLKWVLDVES